MQKQNPLATGLSLLFLALLLASLAARFWAVDRAWQKTGPTHLAANNGQVYLFAAGELFHLSFDGTLLGRFPEQLTGLKDDPIDMRLGEDGTLLIAEQKPALIRSCNTETWTCQELAASLKGNLEQQFKVLPGGAPYQLLVTDAPGDTLWGLEDASDEAREMLPARLLAGPNDLALDHSGHLWVADTDHRRIVELLPAEDGTFEAGRRHSTMNSMTEGERYYPVMLALAQDGSWWVTQTSEHITGSADVVVYDPDEGVLFPVDLPGSFYPTDIAVAGTDMLITDFDQFEVYRVNSQSYEVSTFGDQKFTDVMLNLRQVKAHYERISTLALLGVIVFGVLLVLTAIKATPRNKRWSQQADAIDFENVASSSPGTSGVHWLERNPSIERSLKLLEQMGFIIPIVLIAGGLALYGWVLAEAGAEPDADLQKKLNELGWILLLGGIVMVSAIPIIRLGLRPMKHKLGSDGAQLYIRLNDGRELVVSPTELGYTRRAIMYQQYSFPLQTGKRQNIYQEGEVESWLLPLLRESTQLSPMQAFKQLWKYRDDLLLWSLAAGGLLGLLMILVSVSRG